MDSNFPLPSPTRPPYTGRELSEMADWAIRQAQGKWYRDWLESEIDKSLDTRDETRFVKLSSEWVRIYKEQCSE